MRDHRPDRTVERTKRSDGRRSGTQRELPSLERDRVQRETLCSNSGGAISDPGRDVDLESRITRRTRHRQPMGEEVPILRDDVEQPRLRRRHYQGTVAPTGSSTL